MEIVNKCHPEIFKRRKNNAQCFIGFQSNKKIYISSGAVTEFGLIAGLSLNFVNEGDMWLFYCDDNTDGFTLLERADKKGKDLHIYSNSLIALFQKRTRCSLPCKFPLTLTGSKYEGKHLINIEINKPME